MNDLPTPDAPNVLSMEQRLEIDRICVDFDQAWRNARPQDLQQAIQDAPPPLRGELFLELLKIDVEYRREHGERVEAHSYLHRFEAYRSIIDLFFEALPSADAHDSSPIPNASTVSLLPTPILANSHAVRLVELIQQYQTEAAADATIDPVTWAAQHTDLREPLERALRGWKHMQHASQFIGEKQEIGDFIVIREIGRGGMGTVFEAQQKSLGRRVALKVLWFGTANDLSAIQRFQREAETVAQLHHTHIVPIYSIGTERSINYFAMQLIDGQSLDQVIKQNANGIDPVTAVTWGLQTAEALAHAHQRGVVHRDVKPSNLMLDKQGQLWLTDFGLAKRSDDVTLSMAGALMGTPRYMSPEQASASTRHVDHRSDIYSLGATLYEALTGHPVHNACSPHGVISQILSAEIVPPRRIRSDLPRDIETVLMKCLEKSPDNRYESAETLASDLRAVLESRPIQARRTSMLENCQRWLARHHNYVRLTTASIVGTLMVLFACWFAWSIYNRWNATPLTIESKNGNLIAEVFDERDKPVTQPLAVPMIAPVDLPSGDYRLRFSAEGFLSQDASVTLRAQESEKIAYNMREQFACNPISAVHDVAFVNNQNHPSWQITYDQHQLFIKTMDGPQSTLPWETFPASARAPGWIWPIGRLTGGNDKSGSLELRPWILPHGEDLNRDGTLDFVIAFRHQGCLAAFSQNGWLWSIAPTEELQSELQSELASNSNSELGRGLKSTIVEEPKWIGDIDQDGIHDLLVCDAAIGMESQNTLVRENRLAQSTKRSLRTISGATGKEIWQQAVPASMFETSDSNMAPLYNRWFVGGYRNSGSSSSGSTASLGRHLLVRQSNRRDLLTGPSIELPTIAIGSMAGQPIVVAMSNTQASVFALNSGAVVMEPMSTGCLSSRRPIIMDLNRDGQSDLLVASIADQKAPDSESIVALSLAESKTMWKREIESHASCRKFEWDQMPELGQVIDLDGDGVPEVLVPSRSSASVPSSRYPWGELTALSGLDGSVKWTAKIYNCDTTADRFMVGPDANGDGVLDVFVASQWGQCDQLVAECRSGSDGSIVWMQSHPILQNGQSYFVASPELWPAGSDGWPQLVVTLRASNCDAKTVLFSTQDGHVTHTASGFDEVRICDTDGDRVSDLCLIENKSLGTRTISAGLDMIAVRGVVREPLRQMGVDQLLDATDFDNDGNQDTLLICGNHIVAKSAADGRTLWRLDNISTMPNSRSISWESTGSIEAERGLWDFDADGVRDILLDRANYFTQASFAAISGKSGRVISEFDFVKQSHQGKSQIQVCDVDHDGRAELLVYGYSDFGIDRRGGFNNRQGRLSLAMFSVLNGQAKFRTSQSREFGGANQPQLPYDLERGIPKLLVTDQNLDGVDDIVLFAEPSQSPLHSQSPSQACNLALRCCSGRDGKTLWEREVTPLTSQLSYCFQMAPSITLLRGDGSACDKVLMLNEEFDAETQMRSLVLQCMDGADSVEWVYRFQTITSGRDHSDRQQLRSAPTIVYGDDGHVRIACHVQAGNNLSRLVVLNEQGEYLGQIDCEQHAFPVNYSVHANDLPGQERDCFLCWGSANGNCHLVTAKAWDNPEVLRQIPLPKSDPTYTELSTQSMVSRQGAYRSVVIVTEHAALKVRCIDLGSGETIWSCMGPNAESFTYPSLNAKHLSQTAEARNSADQFVLFHSGDQAICRVAWKPEKETLPMPTINDAKDRRSASLSRSVATPPAPVRDFRLMRHLPGVEKLKGDLPELVSQQQWMILAGSWVLFIFPFWHLRDLVRKRKWSIRKMMLTATIVAVAILFLQTVGRHIRSEVVWASLLATPASFFVLGMLGYCWNKRFVPVVGWLCLAVLSGAAYSVLTPELVPSGTFGGSAWEADEHLSFDGVLFLFLPGLLICSYLYVIVFLLSKAVPLFSKGFKWSGLATIR